MPFPIEMKFIEETEAQLGVKFPEKFKTKMLRSNGGTYECTVNDEEYVWELFPFWDKSDKKRLSRTCNHIGLETKKMRETAHFPKNGVAIAEDGGGNSLIFLPQENNPKILRDTVYIWQHETDELEEVPDGLDEISNC